MQLAVRVIQNLLTLRLLFPLAEILGAPSKLVFTLKDLSRHVLINGGTGMGKSRVFMRFTRMAIVQHMGLTLIDPHGGVAKDLLAYIAAMPEGPAKDDILSRLIYIEPGPDMAVAIDPFDYQPPPGVAIDYRSIRYVAWLAQRVDNVAEIILRRQGETNFEGMPRLERWLKNVLYAVGIAYDDRGTHLGLEHALTLLDPQRPEHAALFERVAPHLPPEILADFRKLKSEKRAKDQEAWVESTINRIRGFFLSPIVRAMFGQHRPALNFKDVITDRKIVLLNLERSDYLSVSHGVTIAGLFIHDLIRAAENIGAYTPEEERIPHMLMIDEAERYLGDDLRMGFAELRKFRLILVMGVQDLSALRTETLDLVPRFISQGGIQISLQQKNPDDIDLLSRFYGLANLDFTELTDRRDRPAGHRKVIVRSVGFGATTGSTSSDSESVTLADGTSSQDSEAHNTQRQTTNALTHSTSRGSSHSEANGESEQKGWSRQKSQADQEGGSKGSATQKSESKGEARAETTAATNTESRALAIPAGAAYHVSMNLNEGKSNARGSSATESRQQSEAQSWTSQDSWALTKTNAKGWNGSKGKSHTVTDGTNRSESNGRTVTNGESEGDSTGHTDGVSHTRSTGLSTGTGTSEGQSVTIGFSESFLPETFEEVVYTGKLRRSVPDQLAFFAYLLRTMPMQHALVATNDTPSFVVKFHDTPDAFEAQGKNRSAAFRRAIMESLKRKLMGLQPFYFSPEEIFAAAPMSPPAPADSTDDNSPIA